jgi:integrase
MLKLTFRKARSQDKTKRGTYYIEGTDHKGRRIHDSLRTGDRDIAKAIFAQKVAETTTVQVEGVKAVVNFANAVKVYIERKGKNSNEPHLTKMLTVLGEKKLCELTQADLDGYAKKMFPGCSNATLKRHVYTPFLAAYNAAVDNEPPLADPKRWKTPKVAKRRGEAPDDEYIAKLMEAARQQGRGKKNSVTGSRNIERDVAALLFITLTGCRTGEAQKLELRHLFLDQNTDTGSALIMDRKNDDPLQVALAPLLVKALREHLNKLHERHGFNAQPETKVFQFDTRYGLPQMIARARRRAGLPHFRPHQIGRHAFASRFLNNGGTTKQLQEAAGWKSFAHVDYTYGHLEKAAVHRFVAEIDTTSLQKLTPNLHPNSDAPDASINETTKKSA